MPDEILDLFAYNVWANHRMLEACAALPEEQLGRDLGSSFPSILGTLAHVASAEWIWLQRWMGSSPAFPAEPDLATLEGVRGRWRVVEEERYRFLSDLDESALLADVVYRTTRGESFTSPLWKLMRHVVNHSTHHRGQVVTMLRQLGANAPNTDMIAYFREQ